VAQASLGRRGYKLLTEGVVVVLSILIAFGLDAWWDGRQQASELRQELTNVLVETENKRSDVAAQTRLLEGVVRGANVLLEIMDAHPGDSWVLVPDTVAYWASRLPTLNPRLSALDGLIASGLLASITDPDLRLALVRLNGEMEDAVTELERMRSVFFSVHSLELGREGFDIAPITRLVEVGGEIQEGDPLPTMGQVRYPNRVTVRNHTRERRVVVQGTLRGFRALAEELAAIEAQIAAYLAT
jgi:hypothetical protein